MSDKITISIQVEPDLHAFVKTQAQAEGRSMGNWIKRLIEFKRAMSPDRPVPTDYSQIVSALAGPGE
jgi:negative regulator of replication initiation